MRQRWVPDLDPWDRRVWAGLVGREPAWLESVLEALGFGIAQFPPVLRVFSAGAGWLQLIIVRKGPALCAYELALPPGYGVALATMEGPDAARLH